MGRGRMGPRGFGGFCLALLCSGAGASSGVPARYWSPVIFVVLALLVLFVTYQRTKDKGIQDRATSGSDSSDLGALVQPQVRDPIPKIPEHTETALDQPDPPQPLQSRFHSPGKVGNGFLDSGRCREPELDAKEEEENSHFLILG
ncbi:uncharacterized protein [Anomalospiza imberbis]|uniref:uncharacterized protein isoform X4 n=1 Tax=Anomalospiza imberbis TaxID=187417 RepID=UPI00358EB3E3